MSRRSAALRSPEVPELPIAGELVEHEPALDVAMMDRKTIEEGLRVRIKGLGEKFAKQSVVLLQKAGLTVNDVESCAAAQDVRKTVDAIDKEADRYFNDDDGDKKFFHKLHAAVCEREREVRVPLATLDAKLRNAIKDFNDAETVKRQAEERRLAEEQRARDHDRALAEAAALEQQGDHVMAVAVVEEQLAAPMPVMVLPTHKELIPTKVEWKWRFKPGVTEQQAVTGVGRSALDLLLLLRTWVPEGSISRKELEKGIALEQARIPREFLEIKTTRANTYVRNMKDAAKGKLGTGVEVYEEEVPR